jgi:hypothetical protein
MRPLAAAGMPWPTEQTKRRGAKMIAPGISEAREAYVKAEATFASVRETFDKAVAARNACRKTCDMDVACEKVVCDTYEQVAAAYDVAYEAYDIACEAYSHALRSGHVRFSTCAAA